MTIVVLGGGIENNKLPEQVKKRLNEAIKISKERGVDRFLVCGKYSFLFDKSEAPEITEAELMKRYLIKQGIDKGNIYLENKSMDTISNAYFAKTEHFLPEGETEGLVITSEYHIPRVKYIFEKIFGKGFDLEFKGIKTGASKRLLERQKELLNDFKEMTEEMDTGDHEFFKDKFFNIDYYKRKRENWIKNLTAKGNE